MIRHAALLGLLVSLSSVVGCAVGPRCTDGCGWGGDSCGTGSCMGEVRARNPIHHLRTLSSAGGCDEPYWGEWPTADRCDECNYAGGRLPAWWDLWGVRVRSARVSSGCSTCETGMAYEVESYPTETIRRSAPMIRENVPGRPLPGPAERIEPAPEIDAPQVLPGPDETTERSIIRPDASRRSARPTTLGARPSMPSNTLRR